MNVSVRDAATFDIDGEQIRRFAEAVLAAEECDSSSTVSITFVDDAAIAALNETHLGKYGPTDVLSFPIEDASPGHPPLRTLGGPPVELGDIFIATNVVNQHAAHYEVGFMDELHLMVCHGLLHVLGWDHQTDPEAAAMEAREAQHLASVGLVRR